MTYLAIALVLLVALLLFRMAHGADLSEFDKGYPAPIAGDPPSAEVHSVVQAVEGFAAASGGKAPRREKVRLLRKALDDIGRERGYTASIEPAAESGPKGEWVLAAHSNPDLRLLYIHGGAFIAGSPLSHRSITSALAEVTGMSVFSLDYRLVPEHPRLAGLEDSIAAAEWLAVNGPQGTGSAERLVIAGDSAGGNLTLSTLQALRDRNLRQADAAIALCPATDATLRSPSFHVNQDSDVMLGKSIGELLRIPVWLRHLIFGVAGRQMPATPALSPVRGELGDLPPTLIHVSLSEMLLDDATRYYHRAKQAGSPVVLETYANMVHVWHLFYPELTEARIAYEHIHRFLAEHQCCKHPDWSAEEQGAA